MDTFDVSGSQQYLQLPDRQSNNLEVAKARHGQRPWDRKSPSELVKDFMIQCREIGPFGTGTADLVHSSFVPPPYQPSVEPLEKLAQIFIKDLRLETHHRGSYLVLRSMTPPSTMTAVMFIVEDENKDATLLQLYQLDDKMDWPSPNINKQNDIVLVKEPYFKVMADGNYGLRVDHISDVAKLELKDPRIPLCWSSQIADLDKSADDWRLEGNDEFKRLNYWKAIQDYNAALEYPLSIEQKRTLRLNRALAHLKNEYFDAALDDTDCLSSPSEASEKALYRAAQALYALGRFAKCHEIVTWLRDSYPNNVDATVQLRRVTQRLEEQENGTYNFENLHEQACKLRPPQLDHATFLGPVVVKTSKGRGRGLFTTKAVKAGDLMLCEKAFAHCYATAEGVETVGASNISLINLHTNRMTMGNQRDLITKTVQKLRRNPSFLPEFTSLHHGTYSPISVSEVDGKPIIDTFLVERIISLNAFGCPLSSLQKRIKRRQKEEHYHHSRGIWLKASYVNHSCHSNVRRSFIGDLMLVRATCDMPADTELKFWYQIPGVKSYHETQIALKNWAFECDCAICTDAKSTPNKTVTRRKVLMGDLLTVLQNPARLDAAKAGRLVAAIEATYKSPASEVPRLACWEPHLLITRAYAASNQPVKVVSTALRFLRSLSFVIKGADPPFSSRVSFEVVKWGLMIDDMIEIWTHLWTAYAVVAPQLCAKAEECARTAYRICVGWDETFEEHCGREAREEIRVRNSLSAFWKYGQG